MDNLAYCNHLFDDSTDGYIHLIQIQEGKVIKIYNTRYAGLKTIVEETGGQEDVYIASSTFYKPKRSTSNIRQFRALYIDIDVERYGKYGKSETVYMVHELVNENKIPTPSMIVDSGRGWHLYWRIKNAPYGAIYTWQEIEDYLYNQLKDLGADIQATEGARVLRLPDTINSRINKECKVLIINDDIEYSMYDLREEYLNYKHKKSYQLEIHQTKEINKKKSGTISRLFNSYTLHLARANDIETLCSLRKYDVKGYRNFILHCYAYWKGIYTRDIEELEKEVIEFNNAFRNPLKESEVSAILRCIPKAISKFIEYEQGVRSGQIKKVTKGMKDKGGYWYKNQTLIERLDITLDEQKHMKSIIGQEEKYRRNNNKRNDNRRNEEGLTKKQLELKELTNKVKNLKEQGLNNSEIARSLNINRTKVIRLLK
ncbi:DNA-binding response regulator [Clostridium tyrobutyricum]|jgi:DNA-binding CsgD family transcriptional regulator|uniref:DNA-binding response regulator n=1 Tax=Clostridium tyrobutyricum TaxID=1519 RepID=UPI0024300255|nr:DNA-binding response regulator [Clostridium tyrobutyricum]